MNNKRALFLDRDGVINIENVGTYILSLREFRFYPKAKEAIAMLSKQFDYIFIVTNQRGVGKGLMSEHDLHEIHNHLIEEVALAGGRIDAIYYATSIDNEHPLRKPQKGMGLAAHHDFKDFDFEQSVMVGNNMSDMQFGKALNMQTVFLHTTKDAVVLPHQLVDLQYESLISFAQSLNQ